MTGETSGALITAVCALGVAFIAGCWWGLYLNLTHWHRMRRWAEWACDMANKEKGPAT